MNLLLKTLALLCCAIYVSHGQAAEIVLREQASQHSSIIRLGDVADIAAASQSELHNLAKTPLLPAPAPGTREYITVQQISDLLVARGLLRENLLFLGANVVEIGEASPPTSSTTSDSSLPVVGTTHSPLTRNELQQQITDALQSYLVDATQHTLWRVDFSLNEKQWEELGQFGGNLQASSAVPPRHGKQRFELSGSAGQKMWMMVDVTQFQTVVVAKQAIERGQLIRRSDLELKQLEGNLPNAVVTELEEVIGKQAERNLRIDEPLQQYMVRAPWQVHRGETVTVFVRTGSIVVRTRAIAKQNGALGELVELETLDSKERLDATVTGPGETAVYAAGGSAADYASLNREPIRR